MKRRDLGLLACVLIVSIVFSVAISQLIFKSSSHNLQAAAVDPITSDFPVSQIQPKYFNNQSNDPLQLIQIGNSNPNPFSPGNNQ